MCKSQMNEAECGARASSTGPDPGAQHHSGPQWASSHFLLLHSLANVHLFIFMMFFFITLRLSRKLWQSLTAVANMLGRFVPFKIFFFFFKSLVVNFRNVILQPGFK